MTESGEVPCTRCGEPVRPDALRCPHCAATFPALPSTEPQPPTFRAEPPPHAEPTPPPVTPPPPAPPPPSPPPVVEPPPDVTAPLPPTVATPPAPDRESSDRSERDRWTGALIALLVVVGPVALFALWSTVTGDDDATPTTTTAAPTTTTTVPPVPGAESEGTWIMALASHTEESRADAQAASLGDLDAAVLLSDDWASLNPGFWVVYVGGFPDGDAVLARCAELGREVPNACVGRFLSTDIDDRDLIAR